MAEQTDLISRIIFRAVDEVSAVLKGISGQMETMTASVNATDTAFATSVSRLEEYQTRVAALATSMDEATARGRAAAGAGTALAGPAMAETSAATQAGVMHQAEQEAQRLTAAQTALATGAAAAGTAEAEAGAKTARAGEAAAATARKVEGSTAAWKKGVSTIALVGAGMLGVIGLSAHLASSYDDALAKVQGFAGVPAQQIAVYRQEILKESAQLGASATNMANGLYYVVSAGFKGKAAMDVLRESTMAAASSNSSFTGVADAVTTALNAYHLSGTQATSVTDMLSASVVHGKTTFDDLAAAIGRPLSVAPALGASLAEVGGAMATLTNHGFSARLAAMGLAGTFNSMIAPTTKMQKEASALGVEWQDLYNVKGHGLVNTLKMINEAALRATSGITDATRAHAAYKEALAALLGNAANVRSFLAMSGDGFKSLSQNIRDVAHSAGTTRNAFNVWGQTTSGELKKVKVAGEDVAITIGTAVLPSIIDLAHTVLPLVQTVGEWATQHQHLVTVLVATAAAIAGIAIAIKGLMLLDSGIKTMVTTAKALGTAWTVLSTKVAAAIPGLQAGAAAEGEAGAAAAASTPEVAGLGVALDIMLGPVGLVIAGIAALVIGFKLAYDHIRPVHDAVNGLISLLRQLLGVLGQLVSAVGEKVVGVFNIMRAVLSFVGSTLDHLCSKIGITKGDLLIFVPMVGPIIEIFRHWHDIIQIVITVFTGLGSVIASFLDAAAKMVSGIPVLGGIFSGLGEILLKVAGAFGHVGHSIDLYARSADGGKSHADALMRSNRHLADSLDRVRGKHHEAQRAIDQTGTHLSLLKTKSHEVSVALVGDANRISSAWDRVGKHIAAAGLAVAGATAGMALGQGHAAAAGINGQYQAASAVAAAPIKVAVLTMPADSTGRAIADEIGKQITHSQAQSSGHNRQVVARLGEGGTNAALWGGVGHLQALVAQLPASMQSAMGPTIAKYAAEVRALNTQFADSIRSEDSRHEQALRGIVSDHAQQVRDAENAAIHARRTLDDQYRQQLAALNQRHEQALRDAHTATDQALAQHARAFRQTVQSHEQAIRQANADYETKVRSLHDAYLQKLSGIHGKNAAERRQQAEETYRRQEAATAEAYKKKVAADDAAIAKAKQSFDNYLSNEKQAVADRLTRAKQAYDDQVAKLNAGYRDHAAKIQQTLDGHVHKLDEQERKKLAAEDAAHKKHLADLKKAYDDHAKKIEAALKTASTPTTFLTSLSSGLTANLKSALDQVTVDVLQHGQATQADLQAVVAATQAQQQFTAAQQTAADEVAAATGDYSTVISDMSKSLKDGLQQAVDKTTYDILTYGQATQSDIAGARAARRASAAFTQAQWDATYASSDAATQAQMLSQRFQHLSQDAATIFSAQQAVDQAGMQVRAAQSALQIDAINQTTQAIKDQTSLLQAQSSVDKAIGQGILDGIKNQAAIYKAQTDLQIVQIQQGPKIAADQLALQQATTEQERQSAQARLTADRLKITIAQDQLQVAIDSAQVNRINDQWKVRIAQDQLKLATDQVQINQRNAAEKATQDQIKLKLAVDGLQIAKDRQKIAIDQLKVQADIASSLGSVNDYGSMIAGDVAALGSDQAQQMADQQAQAAAAAQAAQVAAEGQQQLALDQQQIAQDQQAADAASLAGQERIAQDQAKLSQDQANQQLAATEANTQAIQQLNANNQARQDQMIAQLEQLVTDSRSAVAANQGRQAPATTAGLLNGLAGQRAATVTPG